MSEPGNCPKCGVPLSYEGRTVATDIGHSEPVSCPRCGWQGYEEYLDTFMSHADGREPGDRDPPASRPHVIDPPPRDECQDRGLRTYRVVYEIDLTAQSPQVAAELAWQCLQEPDSIPPVFTILDSDGKKTDVDLYARGSEDAPIPPGGSARGRDHGRSRRR